MGKRQEAAFETKRKLLEAAKSLLHEKKASDIAIEEITSRAGVAKGSFYTHFKRKEDAICCAALDKYSEIKKETLSSSDGIYKNLCSYLNRSVSIIDEYTLTMAQGWMQSATAPIEQCSPGLSKYNFDCENVSTVLKNAVQNGELINDTPINELTNIIINEYYGTVAVWCITSGNVSLTESMRHFCEHGLKSILDKFIRGGHNNNEND